MPTFVAYLMALLIPAADYIIASHLVPPGRDESLLSVVLIVLQLIAAAALGFVVSQRANALLSTALALIGVCIGVLVNADLLAAAADCGDAPHAGAAMTAEQQPGQRPVPMAPVLLLPLGKDGSAGAKAVLDAVE